MEADLTGHGTCPMHTHLGSVVAVPLVVVDGLALVLRYV